MKKDWSTFRITVLLYIIVAMIPVSYYFVNRSFASMQSDAVTMDRLVFINGAVQRVVTLSDTAARETLIKETDTALEAIDHTFIALVENAEYVELFRAKEGYEALKNSWMGLQSALQSKDETSIRQMSAACWNDINSFSKVVEEMNRFKGDEMLDIVYLSLLFTMLFVLTLIYLIRLYIRIQLQRHAIHDHVTGLYNHKYYKEVLEKTQLLSKRRESPFVLFAISFENYTYLEKLLDRRSFNAFLHNFGKELEDFFRHSDTICRIEPNLFVVIAPDATLDNGLLLAKRLEERLVEHGFELREAGKMHLGVAAYDKEKSRFILDEATEAMQESSGVSIGGRS